MAAVTRLADWVSGEGRIKKDDLDRRGMIRNQARLTGVVGGRPWLGDGTVPDVTNVECTGFVPVFDWIAVPVFDEHSWPEEYRGLVEDALRLYFCGLSRPRRSCAAG
jgi:putative flavoprotein involved in K+ transport